MPETNFIISPHDICDSCNGPSGPKFSLNTLRGISTAHRSNIIPTGVDLQSRLDDIRDAQINSDALEVEIARLEATVEVMKQRKVQLDNFKQQEMSLFAPIRSLPDDVLQKIFTTCQEEFGEVTNPGYIQYTDPNTFVRTATQVSTHWRNTALSMPLLWSRVSLARHDKKRSKSMSRGEFLERCIVLSGSVPLSIDFGDCEFDPDTLGDKCLKELAKSAHRWEHITGTASDCYSRPIKICTILKYVPENTVFHSLKTLGPVGSSHSISLHSTPLLTHLAVNGNSYAPSTISFPSAPLLTSLSTPGQHEFDLQKVLGTFPWSQITHYECKNAFYDPVILPTLLNRMPNLISLTMDLNKQYKLSTNITLPKLEVLTFNFVKVATEPLRFFITPSLKELTVKGECNSKLIVELLTRSRCNIEKLSLNANTLVGEKWNDHDNLVGGVNHLVVCWDDLKGGKHATTMKYLAKKIFPRLEILELKFLNGLPAGKPFPVDDFKALVTSRIPSKAKRGLNTVADLKSVTLTCPVDNLSQRNLLKRFSISVAVRQAKVDFTLRIDGRGNDSDSE